MKRPETRYARSGDVMVAFQVTGEGNPIDLVLAPGTISHLELTWEFPEVVALYERLSTFVRLIRFDKRGTGMSDRPAGAATLEERTDDVRAVMDAADSERAFILGYSEGGNMACAFAAAYPERTLGTPPVGRAGTVDADRRLPVGPDDGQGSPDGRRTRRERSDRRVPVRVRAGLPPPEDIERKGRNLRASQHRRLRGNEEVHLTSIRATSSRDPRAHAGDEPHRRSRGAT